MLKPVLPGLFLATSLSSIIWTSIFHLPKLRLASPKMQFMFVCIFVYIIKKREICCQICIFVNAYKMMSLKFMKTQHVPYSYLMNNLEDDS